MSEREEFREIATIVQALGKGNTAEGKAILNVLDAFRRVDPCLFAQRAPRGYTPEQCYVLFIHSALLQTSLEGAGRDLLERGIIAPLGEAVIDALKALSLDQLVANMDALFQYQWQSLPSEVQSYLARQLVVSLDTVQHPYYGQVEKAQVIKGQKKASSMNHFVYASIKILWEGHGLTLAVRMLHKGQDRTSWVNDLLTTVNAIGSPLVVLADGEFWVNELLAQWYQKGWGWIVHVGGGTSHAALVRELHHRAKISQDLVTAPYPIFLHTSQQWFSTQLIAWADNQGTTYCTGVPDYLTSLPADWLISLGRNRFGIDTGYRLWNELRPRTCSRDKALRYALVATAVALYNAYSLERTSPHLADAPQSRHWRTLRSLLKTSPRSLTPPPSPHRVLKLARRLTPDRLSLVPPTSRRFDRRPVHRKTCSTGPLSKNLSAVASSLTISRLRSLWLTLITLRSDWVYQCLKNYALSCLPLDLT